MVIQYSFVLLVQYSNSSTSNLVHNWYGFLCSLRNKRCQHKTVVLSECGINLYLYFLIGNFYILNAAFACSLFTFFLKVKKTKENVCILLFASQSISCSFLMTFLVELQLFFLEMYHVILWYLSNIPDFSFILYIIAYLHWSFALSSTSFTSLLLYVYFLHSLSVPSGTSPVPSSRFSHVLAFPPLCPLISSRYCAVSVSYLISYDGSVPVGCSQIILSFNLFIKFLSLPLQHLYLSVQISFLLLPRPSPKSHFSASSHSWFCFTLFITHCFTQRFWYFTMPRVDGFFMFVITLCWMWNIVLYQCIVTVFAVFLSYIIDYTIDITVYW